MSRMRGLLGPVRVPFLILTFACVLLGLATAVWTTGHIHWLHLALGLIGALSAHISVNVFNEYYDFKSGLDGKTLRTPFSGGSGTLPAMPELAAPTQLLAWASFGVTALIGLYFLAVRGIGLLPLGALGLLIILAYTNWITRSPLLCLLAPGLGFGPLMVMGIHFILTGRYSWTAGIASLVPFFLVSNLLLLNQFPDVEADRTVGRKHYPIAIGRQRSGLLFIGFLLLSYLAIGFGVCARQLPWTSLFGLATVVIGVPLVRGVLQYADNRERLIPHMGQNVIVCIATPALVAVGLLVGR
ncbi:MAG: prenyltransferase [Deltaproteobacteria bacterium]|nr:prenyltransferase [Deltaproteobacteria bacterium]